MATQARDHHAPPHRPGEPGDQPRQRRVTYVALANESDPMGAGVPDHVEKEFRGYLKCGILAHGFARARCSSCGYDFLVDHVIPHGQRFKPVRQVVLSVPKRLRPFLHHRPQTASAVLHILLRALQATLREACPTAPTTASFGAVSFDAA